MDTPILSFTDKGHGPAVVLVHGFPIDRRMWDAQLAELAGHHRVIVPDLRGLILVDTKAEADSPQQREGRAKMIDLVRKSGAKAVADEMLPKLVAEDTPRTRPAVAAAVRKMAEACPSKTIEHALVAMRDRPDRSDQLPSIAVPTLIIVGDADAITPVAVAESMQKRIPNARLAVIKGSGHMSPMEQPAQVNQAMSRFLREQG